MRKGFTLIELAIVIAVVAMLSVIVLLVLNPVELLRQSRDASRLSDMSVLSYAIGLYLANVPSPAIGLSTTCYTSNATTTARCGGLFGPSYISTSATASRLVNGLGWLPVDLTAIPSGSPIGVLPVDPLNDNVHYYAYAPNAAQSTYELDAKMESTKYSNGGARDVESTDHGNNDNWYEVGTAPGLSF